MIKKIVLAAAAGLMLAVSAPSPEAKADVDIIINLGFGGFYGRNISCATGRRIVDRRFNNVRAYDCVAPTYAYTGRRNGKLYAIYVDARRGVIKDVKRVRR